MAESMAEDGIVVGGEFLLDASFELIKGVGRDPCLS